MQAIIQLLKMKSGGDDISCCVKTALAEHCHVLPVLFIKTSRKTADWLTSWMSEATLLPLNGNTAVVSFVKESNLQVVSAVN